MATKTTKLEVKRLIYRQNESNEYALFSIAVQISKSISLLFISENQTDWLDSRKFTPIIIMVYEFRNRQQSWKQFLYTYKIVKGKLITVVHRFKSYFQSAHFVNIYVNTRLE